LVPPPRLRPWADRHTRRVSPSLRPRAHRAAQTGRERRRTIRPPAGSLRRRFDAVHCERLRGSARAPRREPIEPPPQSTPRATSRAKILESESRWASTATLQQTMACHSRSSEFLSRRSCRSGGHCNHRAAAPNRLGRWRQWHPTRLCTPSSGRFAPIGAPSVRREGSRPRDRSERRHGAHPVPAN